MQRTSISSRSVFGSSVRSLRNVPSSNRMRAAMQPRGPRKIFALLTPSALFQCASSLVFPAYFSMIFFPKAKFTQTLLSKPYLFALFGLFYTIGIYQAATTGAFQPALDHGASIASIGALMANKLMVALAWCHLLCLDLFAARYVFFDAVKKGVEHRISVVLCFMFGPLGILSHCLFTAMHMKMLLKNAQVQRSTSDGTLTFRFE